MVDVSGPPREKRQENWEGEEGKAGSRQVMGNANGTSRSGFRPTFTLL